MNWKDKIVIMVDDGIATGSTIMATIELVRTDNPKIIVVAVPVGPIATVHRLEERADEVVCLHTPSDFFAIGQFYENFEQVSDEEVTSFLQYMPKNHQSLS